MLNPCSWAQTGPRASDHGIFFNGFSCTLVLGLCVSSSDSLLSVHCRSVNVECMANGATATPEQSSPDPSVFPMGYVTASTHVAMLSEPHLGPHHTAKSPTKAQKCGNHGNHGKAARVWVPGENSDICQPQLGWTHQQLSFSHSVLMQGATTHTNPESQLLSGGFEECKG